MLLYNYDMNSPDMVPETALILVAVMNSPRDMEIARMLGWYRIPLRNAPKVVDVDYLAFYQTSGFEKEDSNRIQYLAKVNGHELTTRRELLISEQNHPRAHEEYYKIQLGTLIRLPDPILATSWKRITFLYTTGKFLMEARVINDLVIRSDERTVLWRALRERIGSNAYASPNEKTGWDISEDQLMEILGYLTLKA